MGAKSFFQEIKTKASASRLFKALVFETHDVVPKCVPEAIKSVEGAARAGNIRQSTAPDGSTIKYVIDSIDNENLTVQYTLFEGKPLGDKVEKIVYVAKFEETSDGGCVMKLTSDYHAKGGAEITDDEIKNQEEEGAGLYKTVGEYLVANPHVCT